MATLAAMLADVYSITKRPDLIAQTTLAVKAATLKAHQSDFYPKDLYETGMEFTVSDYYQALEYRSLVPRFRALKYIRKSDVSAMVDGDFISIVSPEATIDSYNVGKTDIAYLAGNVINIRSSTSLQYIFFGCYVNPDITDDGYDSWISDDHPFAITFEAISLVYKGIGFDEQASLYLKLVAEQYAELRMDSVLAVGY